MKKFILLIIVVVMQMLMACSIHTNKNEDVSFISTSTENASSEKGSEDKEKEEHVHVFDGEWYYDESSHWNLCICGQKSNTIEHMFGEWLSNKTATETEEGLMIRSCSGCGYEEQRVIGVLEHTHMFQSERKKDEGLHWYECECGEKSEVEVHDYDEWRITKEPTEENEGAKHHTCKKCGYIETVKVPNLLHVHYFEKEWKNNSAYHWEECQCGEKNKSESHTYGEWYIIEDSSCTKIGIKEHICLICGYKEKEILAKKKHVEIVDSMIEATCTIAGKTEGKHCSECNMVLVAQETIPSKGHQGEEWIIEKEATYTENGSKYQICSICETKYNVVEIPTILSYQLLEDNTYMVIGFTDEQQTILHIPEMYNGKLVIGIGKGAFENSNIESLTLSDSIKFIEDEAFKNCNKLSKIEWSASIGKLGENVFVGCDMLLISISSKITENVTLDKTNKIYVIEENVQIKNTATLTIGQGVTIIGNNNLISNYGKIEIIGSEFEKVNMYGVRLGAPNTDYDTPNTILMKYVNYRDGFFLKPGDNGSGAHYSYISIDNCSFVNVNTNEMIYLWYPKELAISNSRFENCGTLYVGTYYGVAGVIKNNIFINCGGTQNDAVIACFAAYGSPLLVEKCSFINPSKYVLAITIDGRMVSDSNDFGTNDVDKIQELIYDGNDDFSVSNVIEVR